MKILKNKIAKRRPINLFFTELIIALLFFSISGAVILKLFASADRKSRLSSVKENAMVCAQSIAEAYSVCGSAEEALKTVFSETPGLGSDGKYTLTLDKLCMPAAGGSVIFTASETVQKTVSGGLGHLSLDFSSDSEVLFSLECTAYSPVIGGGDGSAQR